MKNMTYAKAVQEVEDILTGIEEEQTGIDELSRQVKRAAELLKFCKEKLQKTENSVREILDASKDNKDA